MAQLSMKSLIECGVHYGHLAKKWNPKMKPHIFGVRNQVHIINLQYTIEVAREAGQFVYNLAKEGKTLLFVGTKKQAQDTVQAEAARVDGFYVNERWLGGTLTNFASIRSIADKYKKIREFLESEEGRKAPKKERSRLEKRAARMFKYAHGTLEMTSLPDAVFVVDICREKIATDEAKKMNIPVIAIVDTNADPEGIRYAIPGNDDALKSIRLFTHYIAESYREGREVFEETKAKVTKGEKKPSAEKASASQEKQSPSKSEGKGGSNER